MKCASVGPGGDVTITWDSSGTSIVNFRSWHLYHSLTAAGPFTLIDSLNVYSPASINDASANAAVNPAYYYIAFASNNGSPDILSDTIRAIGLNLNNPGSGFANLSWNPTHQPLIATNNPFYYLYKEYPTGVFTLIDSIDARTANIPMTYSDLITICDDTIKYKIEVRDSSGCVSSSFIKGDRFHDFQVPAIPVLDSISVDLAGNATVTWQTSISSDTWSYVVLQNPGPVPVDTVIGHNSTTLNTTINAGTGSLSFVVIAVDSCNNPSAPSTAHSSIFLTAGFDLCTHSAVLDWTAYSYWGLLPSYEVYVSINGGPESLIGTTSQTNFNDTNLISGSIFCYRVHAIENGGSRTTTSNRICITPNYPPPPAFSFLRNVTITSPNEILITAYVDSTPTVTGYRLYRSTSPAGPFSQISAINVSGVSTIIFNDEIDTETGPYYYYITTIDSCGRSVISSQVGNTILATGISDINLTNAVEWSMYNGWPAGADQYLVYRSSNGIIDSLPIAILSGSDSTYSESVINDFFTGGKFCYIIIAVEAPGDPDNNIDSSRSNEVCLEQEPIIFIPNAFHPGGIFNEIFIPSNGFVSPEGYSLDIYNRWGEHIFNSIDPSIGWDGTFKGSFSQEGIYIYRLVTKNNEGSRKERVGSVTLIR